MEYIAIGDVAKMLNVSTSTVRQYVKDNKVSCTYTLGGHRRFSPEEINSIIAITRSKVETDFNNIVKDK